MAYGAAVEGTYNTRKVQCPVAHPRAAEVLDGHGKSQAAMRDEAAVGPDERPISNEQGEGSVGVR